MAAQARKRTYQQLLTEEEDMLLIKLAAPDDSDSGAGEPPLRADRMLLVAVSSCVRGMPEGATEWDLSQLRIEGAPVTHGAVATWLDAAYKLILNEPHPSGPFIRARRSAAHWTQVLSFAEAVGSSGGLLQACAPCEEDELEFVIQVPPPTMPPELEQQQEQEQEQQPEEEEEQWPQPVRFRITERYAWHAYLTLIEEPAAHRDSQLVFKVASTGQKDDMSAQLAQQVEGLLFLAHKLGLPKLVQALHGFVGANAGREINKLLHSGDLDTVFSQRVLGEAPAALSRQALVDSVMRVPCSFVAGRHQTLKPLSEPELGTPANGGRFGAMTFLAEVVQDGFLGMRLGTQAHVELDVFDAREYGPIRSELRLRTVPSEAEPGYGPVPVLLTYAVDLLLRDGRRAHARDVEYE